MVDRFQRKKVAVFDLDGTLLSINSYKVFLVTWFAWLLMRFNFNKIKALLVVINKRNKNLINRKDAKQYILELYLENRNDSYERYLIKLLYLFKRRVVFKYLKILQVNHDVILATAAYCFYAKPLAKKFKIEKVVCTLKNDIPNNRECIGAEKFNRIKDYYGIQKFSHLFTDHSDDLPLFDFSDEIYLVKPRKKCLEAIKSKFYAGNKDIIFL